MFDSGSLNRPIAASSFFQWCACIMGFLTKIADTSGPHDWPYHPIGGVGSKKGREFTLAISDENLSSLLYETFHGEVHFILYETFTSFPMTLTALFCNKPYSFQKNDIVPSWWLIQVKADANCDIKLSLSQRGRHRHDVKVWRPQQAGRCWPYHPIDGVGSKKKFEATIKPCRSAWQGHAIADDDPGFIGSYVHRSSDRECSMEMCLIEFSSAKNSSAWMLNHLINPTLW